MITEYMTLVTLRDAYQWASECAHLTDAQVGRLGNWIWANKPYINCTYTEHPICELEPGKLWEIAGDEDHDNFIEAVNNGAEIVEFEGGKYALNGDAYLSNRAETGGGYTEEWYAPAVGRDGCDYLVVWQFDKVNDEGDDASNNDWSDIYDVKRI